MEFKSRHKYGYEINLQRLSTEFIYTSGGRVSIDQEYTEKVTNLAIHRNLWKAKKEVEDDISSLINNEEFISDFLCKVDYDTPYGYLLGDYEEVKSNFVLTTSLSSFLVIKESFDDEGFLSIDDRFGINYFMPVTIAKEDENFEYFFSLSIQDKRSGWISEFLSFQLKENFNSSFKEFASFLICLIADQEVLINESTKSFIRDWINLNKSKSGYSQIGEWTHRMTIIKMNYVNKIAKGPKPSAKQLRSDKSIGGCENLYQAYLSFSKKNATKDELESVLRNIDLEPAKKLILKDLTVLK